MLPVLTSHTTVTSIVYYGISYSLFISLSLSLSLYFLFFVSYLYKSGSGAMYSFIRTHFSFDICSVKTFEP